MNIRKFEPKDAEFCFKVRCKAFTQKFHNELSSKEIAACVSTYRPKDYIIMAEKVEFFVIEENARNIGFFTIQRKNQTTAEIPLIYIDLNHTGKGIGKACIQYIEDWITSNWSKVQTIFLDTIIPKNNSDFYKKVGFEHTKETFCDFQGLRIKALRFSKKLKS
jgi:GNAT superfamily N-acetyltransferase